MERWANIPHIRCPHVRSSKTYNLTQQQITVWSPRRAANREKSSWIFVENYSESLHTFEIECKSALDSINEQINVQMYCHCTACITLFSHTWGLTETHPLTVWSVWIVSSLLTLIVVTWHVKVWHRNSQRALWLESSPQLVLLQLQSAFPQVWLASRRGVSKFRTLCDNMLALRCDNVQRLADKDFIAH